MPVGCVDAELTQTPHTLRVGLDLNCEKNLVPVPASADKIPWHLEGGKENSGLGV